MATPKNLGAKRGNARAAIAGRQSRAELRTFEQDARSAVQMPAVQAKVVQAAHGFTAGKVVQLGAGGAWALATRSGAATLDHMIGLVTVVVSANIFIVVLSGPARLPPSVFTPIDTMLYYLGSTAGSLNAGSATTSGGDAGFNRPILITGKNGRLWVLPSSGRRTAIYGFVRWDITSSTTNVSECEICNEDGTRIGSPTIGWIDSLHSVAPKQFGEIFYELEYANQTATLDGVHTRPLYRAVREMGTSTTVTGTIAAIAVADATTQNIYKVQTSAGVDITTTINGSATKNRIALWGLGAGIPAAAGEEYDIPFPPSQLLDHQQWKLIPEYRVRPRFGGLPIDQYEPFRVGVWFHHISSNGEAGFGYAEYTVLAGWNTAQWEGKYSAVKPGSPTVTGVGVAGDISASATFNPAGGMSSGTIATTIGGGSSYQLVLTFTQDTTTKRITGITISISSTPATYTVGTTMRILSGGRGALWPN